MMKKPGPKAYGLKKKELREVLARPDTQLDPELCEPINGITAYRLPGDKVLLVFHDGKGTVFEPRDEYIEMVRTARAAMEAGPVHMLKGLLPQGRDFPAHVPALIDHLAEVLRIPRKALDGSVESLERFDAAIRRRGPMRCLEPEVFPAILAYAGEVVLKEKGGRWEMRLDSDGEIWEPWIVDGEGQAQQLFAGIYKELYEQGKRSCYVGSIVRVAIGPKLQGLPYKGPRPWE